MRYFVRNLSIALGCLVFSAAISAQAPPSEGGLALLQQISSAFSGQAQGSLIHTIKLQATEHSYTGAQDYSGEATITVATNGSYNVTLNQNDGQHTQSVNIDSLDHSCSWSGADGIIHAYAQDDCWAPVPWVLPALCISQGGITAEDDGLQLFNGITAHRLRIGTEIKPLPTPAAAALAKQSEASLYVDVNSHQITGLTYTTSGSSRIRPNSVEILYSNYHAFGSLSIPTHIEKRFNGALQIVLEIIAVNPQN